MTQEERLFSKVNRLELDLLSGKHEQLKDYVDSLEKRILHLEGELEQKIKLKNGIELEADPNDLPDLNEKDYDIGDYYNQVRNGVYDG